MQIDEKIALMEKEYRNYQRKEVTDNLNTDTIGIKYTVEGLRRWIKRKKVILGFQVIHFEKRRFLNETLIFPYMVDFFDIEEDSEHSLWLASNTQNVTITAAKLDSPQKRDSLNDWKEYFHKEMLENKIYTDIQKTQAMEYLDYLCYETPTAKGPMYHITYRMYLEQRFFIGTFNCESKKKEKMGLLLEALVQEMNDLQKEERGIV